jgi:HEAT repeat protein
VFQGLVGGAGTVGVILDQQLIPSARYWTDHQWLLYVSIGAVGLAAAVTPIIEAVLDQLNRYDYAARLALLELLLRSFHRMVEESSENYSDIGLHVFLVRRPVRRAFRAEQVPMASVELPQRAAPLIRWTRGKGVIGQCWENPGKGAAAADLTALAKAFATYDATQWQAIPPAKRLGLNFNEVQATERLGAVVAWPVLDARKAGSRSKGYRGCVSLDGIGSCYDALTGEKVFEALKSCADGVLAAIAAATR